MARGSGRSLSCKVLFFGGGGVVGGEEVAAYRC